MSCKMAIPDFSILKKIPALRIQEIKDIKHQKINIESHIRFSKIQIKDVLKDQSNLLQEVLNLEKEELRNIAKGFVKSKKNKSK